jgi:hypothetical protein
MSTSYFAGAEVDAEGPSPRDERDRKKLFTLGLCALDRAVSLAEVNIDAQDR